MSQTPSNSTAESPDLVIPRYTSETGMLVPGPDFSPISTMHCLAMVLRREHRLTDYRIDPFVRGFQFKSSVPIFGGEDCEFWGTSWTPTAGVFALRVYGVPRKIKHLIQFRFDEHHHVYCAKVDTSSSDDTRHAIVLSGPLDIREPVDSGVSNLLRDFGLLIGHLNPGLVFLRVDLTPYGWQYVDYDVVKARRSREL